MPDGPIITRPSQGFTPPAPAQEVPRTGRDAAQMGRTSGPLQPPRAFVPPLNPKANQDALQAEHDRLRPDDTLNRFRSGVQPHPGKPPQILNAQPPQVRLGVGPAQPVVNLNPNYPKWKYHASAAPAGIIVNDPDDEQTRASGDGWQDAPIPGALGLTVAQRLELLESLMHTLAEEAVNEAETPEECLARIIAERDDFARKFAAGAKGPKAGAAGLQPIHTRIED